jgi:F-type H+-transporting ATPase subunit delta
LRVSHPAARRYANALYDVARAHDRLEPVRRDLAAVAALVRGHADLAAAFDAPLVPVARKRALVDALLQAGGGVAVEVHRLLAMLADRDRLVLIDDIATDFEARAMESSRQAAATVVTAEPLPADREAALARALGEATGRQVTIHTEVDPGIVGGMVARVGGVVFDASVTGQLERLRHRLREEA